MALGQLAQPHQRQFALMLMMIIDFILTRLPRQLKVDFHDSHIILPDFLVKILSRLYYSHLRQIIRFSFYQFERTNTNI